MRFVITTFITLAMLLGFAFAQIEIDGDMLDWAGIEPLDQDPLIEPTGELPSYPDFDLKHLYITHDSANVYVRIDLADGASFDNFYNFENPPVFEFYMDTEIGDTTGFDWGWWNIAMNYYVNLATTLNPDSVEKYGELYHYTGNRIPTWAEGEFVFLGTLPMAVNDDGNSLEFAIPRDMVNFGSEFRPWVYSVANYQWGDGADQLPDAGGWYMLKYDFWYGGSVYAHHGDNIMSAIEIDGDMLDWASIPPADVDEIAEDLGDMPTGPEFDVKDVYVTSDSTYLYMRVDIDPSATFAGMYNNYTNAPAFQIFLDVNWGDTTGLGYGGFWRLAADYMVDLSAALHPDSTGNTTPIYQYVGDWMGAFEEFAPVPDAYAMFAKNDDDNAVEIAIPRAAINVDTDVRPWLYVVGDQNWDNEEYWPNTVVEGWSDAYPEVYYAYNYNFISGGSVHKIADKALSTAIEDQKTSAAVEGFGLVTNYPNPFNPQTTIEFTVTKKQPVTLTIFDITGQKIATLLNNQVLNPGRKHVTWHGLNQNGNPVASGIYFYSLSSDNFSVTKKMVLVR
ncbi:hypothetical protein Calab_2827 [Caldithrix abyssi DSM 13497]|uniref:Por secretion system C-terminal sorting domain-containing protein n=1 Tax=Caldithrix abyssi DSM 13497 TaxID=880073 RepID=H1XRF3_CALAY|nr:T9SS type A sorting domain-containing protein [Caldithrix abyssi]APF18428.1 Por secretion system C-terminal sorting domain-containing protein [Caldithrix abyssi DSM 13497]EHO42434.1 hypothetical protein Calab_2827 [Caldithrix abyssi DSM 13497]